MGEVRSVAVLGAGHGGHAAAADLALRGYDVSLFSRSADALAAVRQLGGIRLRGAAGEGMARPRVVTNDLREAVSGADLVMLVVPATAHEHYARALAPILQQGQVIFVNPGQTGGGLHLVAELRRAGFEADIQCCEVSTLTYGCRLEKPADVAVYMVATALPFSAFPGRNAPALYRLMQTLYPSISLAANVLETGFQNINAVEHPPQTVLNAGWIEHTRGDYYFYYEGTTPSVGRVIDALDRERLAVAKALGVATKPFVRMFADAGYTTAHAAEVGTAYQAVQESAPNRTVTGPRSLDHRYLHEDVGCGLVPWSSLGRLAGVSTPVMDHLVGLAGVLNDRDYAAEGRSLEKMGLQGIAVEELDRFLERGGR